MESRVQRSVLGSFEIDVDKQIARAIYLFSSEKSETFIEKASAPQFGNGAINLLPRLLERVHREFDGFGLLIRQFRALPRRKART
ncbi:MAG: hypothetical protein ACR2JB_18790 [Bryobacteraceae bacterium]